MPDHDGCAFAVVKESDGSTVACHKDRASADGQVRALYASESFNDGEREEFGGSWKPDRSLAPSNLVPGQKLVSDAVRGIKRQRAPKPRNYKGGGGGGQSFAARVDAVEQALCALADVLFEQRADL